MEYIRKSKVPLIKFEYEDTHFDISVDKADGISQVKYVEKISELFPEFKYLTLVFKCTLRIRGLADTYTGGIGSFLLSCMILVYLKITVEKRASDFPVPLSCQSSADSFQEKRNRCVLTDLPQDLLPF